MRVLIREFKGENSELYLLIENRRIMFGKCEASVKIWNEETSVPILTKGVKVKNTHIVITVGENISCSGGQSVETLQKARSIELLTDLQRENGNYERVTINIQPNEIDMDTGTWECEVQDFPTRQKLIEFR